ncbi:MAG TPA: hypothetical protein P5571_07375 [Candidatus Krumholzibacteria bacterium]|nr:hypothetical protein [Candidatus Krumholzibacteria bacterium]HRX51162.1 hypothetical protein [Candidatus Krumholzibacteria bacterium]
MHKSKHVLLHALLALLLVLGVGGAVQAQDDELVSGDELEEFMDEAGSDSTGVDIDAAVAVFTARKHPSLLAVSVSGEHMIPLNVLKELVYDINDLKKAAFGMGLGVRAYVLDGLALSVHGRTTTIGFVDDKPEAMAPINALLDEHTQLTPDAGIKMDGITVAVTAYIGKQVMPESHFNPYFSGAFLYYDWAVTTDGRDGGVLSYQGTLLEGSDPGVGIGFGTEYALSDKLLLDVGLMWNFVLTGDEVKFVNFESTNKSQYWTNTQWWGLSVGLVLGL